MKLYLTSFFLIFVCSCSNLSPNKKQLQTTYSNIDCFDQLISIIKNDTELQDSIISLRNSSHNGPGENFNLKKEYRIISIEGIISDTSWINDCYSKISKESDLYGIRYINEDQIIIEVDNFKRHTLNEQYSSNYAREFHRLIYSKKSINRSSYYRKMEVQLWTDTIRDGLIYEVTQIQ